MALGGLADHEGVQSFAVGCRGVQHRDSDRVGAEGQSASGLECPVGGEVAHDASDEGGRDAVQGHPAQVDVVVGFLTGRQRDPSVDDGQVLDLLDELCLLYTSRCV